MTERNVIDLSTAKDAKITGAYKVDPRSGTTNARVQSQWFARPDDERFLSLQELYDFVKDRADNSWADTLESRTIELRAVRDDPYRLDVVLPSGHTLTPTHWSFGQLCTMVGAPASFLRTLPGGVAAIPLQYKLRNHRQEMAKVFVTTKEGVNTMRAVNSPTYGRILDKEVVEQVMRVAGDEWRVPGLIDWRTLRYDPYTPVTKKTTTLYASDRDVFMFMCNPDRALEVGRLADGSPDIITPGFIVSNSETGSRSLQIDLMYFRAVCQNRMIWGVEQQLSYRVRHTKWAPERFAAEAAPALLEFADMASQPVLNQVRVAQQKMIANNDEERVKFLRDLDFSKNQAETICATVFAEEGHPPESVWDFVNGITAFARDIPHQDQRIETERLAGRLMSRVA